MDAENESTRRYRLNYAIRPSCRLRNEYPLHHPQAISRGALDLLVSRHQATGRSHTGALEGMNDLINSY